MLQTWGKAWEARPAVGALVNPDTGEPNMSMFDPEVVYEDGNLPDHIGETYHGVEGVIRATERWTEPFEELTVELERIVGSGECLVSVHRFRSRR